MSNKDERSYTIKRVDEEQQAEPSQGYVPEKEVPYMPMENINEAGVLLAFFIVICATGFSVYLLNRVVTAGGFASRAACLVLALIVIGAVIGIFATTVNQFREQKRVGRLVFSLLIYAAAVALGIVVGMMMCQGAF